MQGSKVCCGGFEHILRQISGGAHVDELIDLAEESRLGIAFRQARQCGLRRLGGEPPVTPVSLTGVLWQPKSHRLICDDSASADVVAQLLGDVRPLLMVTELSSPSRRRAT